MTTAGKGKYGTNGSFLGKSDTALPLPSQKAAALNTAQSQTQR